MFQVFDDQDSGNICFGVESGEKRYFVKFAGAPTLRGTGTPKDAVERLKAALPLYQDLQQESLIRLEEAVETEGGFALVFQWAEGDCMGRMYPEAHRKFMALPIERRMAVFRDILRFLEYTASRQYLAVDFYDGSILYDFESGRTSICDIDFFRRMPCVNDMGRMWGSSFNSKTVIPLIASINSCVVIIISLLEYNIQTLLYKNFFLYFCRCSLRQ